MEKKEEGFNASEYTSASAPGFSKAYSAGPAMVQRGRGSACGRHQERRGRGRKDRLPRLLTPGNAADEEARRLCRPLPRTSMQKCAFRRRSCKGVWGAMAGAQVPAAPRPLRTVPVVHQLHAAPWVETVRAGGRPAARAHLLHRLQLRACLGREAGRWDPAPTQLAHTVALRRHAPSAAAAASGVWVSHQLQGDGTHAHSCVTH